MNEKTNLNFAIAVATMLGTTVDAEHPFVPIGAPHESLHEAIRAGDRKLKDELLALADDGKDCEDVAIPNARILNVCLALLAEQQWGNLPPNARKLLAIIAFVLEERERENNPLARMIEQIEQAMAARA